MDKIVAKENDVQVAGWARSGVGALGAIGTRDIVPPMVGGLVALGSTLLIRKLAGGQESPKPALIEWAPLLGAGIGVVASLPLVRWGGRQAVISGAVASIMVGGGLKLYEWASLKSWALPKAPGSTGLLSVTENRRRLRGMQVVEGGGGRAIPTAQVPVRVQSAMDVTAFAANT